MAEIEKLYKPHTSHRELVKVRDITFRLSAGLFAGLSSKLPVVPCSLIHPIHNSYHCLLLPIQTQRIVNVIRCRDVRLPQPPCSDVCGEAASELGGVLSAQ